MDDVVVLPCAPATDMPLPQVMICTSASDRCITGICLRRASTTSAFVSRIAEEMTTTSASCRFSAFWPMQMRAPCSANLSVMADRLRSDPDTIYPFSIKTLAIARMPAPAMPIKCTFRTSLRLTMVLHILTLRCFPCVGAQSITPASQCRERPEAGPEPCWPWPWKLTLPDLLLNEGFLPANPYRSASCPGSS